MTVIKVLTIRISSFCCNWLHYKAITSDCQIIYTLYLRLKKCRILLAICFYCNRLYFNNTTRNLSVFSSHCNRKTYNKYRNYIATGCIMWLKKRTVSLFYLLFIHSAQRPGKTICLKSIKKPYLLQSSFSASVKRFSSKSIIFPHLWHTRW